MKCTLLLKYSNLQPVISNQLSLLHFGNTPSVSLVLAMMVYPQLRKLSCIQFYLIHNIIIIMTSWQKISYQFFSVELFITLHSTSYVKAKIYQTPLCLEVQKCYKNHHIHLASLMYNTYLVLHNEFDEDFVSLTDCGGRVHSYGTGGIIVSPGFPEKYSSRTYCRWTIKASSPFNDILIYFFAFQTEGTGNEYTVITF